MRLRDRLGLPIILSGGSPKSDQPPEAQTLAAHFGLRGPDVRLETTARNSSETAEAVAAMLAGAPNPHKPHPGDLLDSHSYQNVGCAICHEGQPLATSVEEAHGHAPHWEQPLLTGDFIQATCTKCHQEDEVPQAPVLTHGRLLLRELGCVACHEISGIEAAEKVGPRLDAIGSKVSLKWL
ncbi:MAG: hypothetical protein IID33_14625, partial [Planctomycetes bacterium]|nr:hypothetical protein [Planctomycetota bacterium]